VAVPDRSGTEVALELFRLHSTAILFISSTPMNGWESRDISNFKRLPPVFVDFIEKPFQPSALLDKVRELLEKHSDEATPRM
jgi:FixJ family two-component response regulator